jgi:hypothetical protein
MNETQWTIDNNIFGAMCFALAIIHTFSVKFFQKLAHKYPQGSIKENFYHLLGEIEVVFGIWAFIMIGYIALNNGYARSIAHLESLNFTEPAFVFVIMVVCATKPILQLAEKLIFSIAKIFPVNPTIAFFNCCLILGPLLGSLITEPAAMTVTALILSEKIFNKKISLSFKYSILALLFVNISIGGTLTPYAAPPVLMVAKTWGWDFRFMFENFGWKTILAVAFMTVSLSLIFKSELKKINLVDKKPSLGSHTPWGISLLHLVFLLVIVLTAHHMVAFMGIFLFFLGLVQVTNEYQNTLKLKEGLLVGFFLGGLVILGSMQSWWLEPILTKLDSIFLFSASIGLTAIADNAAITYLGSLVPSLSDESKYSLVAGAVAGGGLTVIANAPNPAGYGILNPAFGKDGINPLKLFLYALPFTLIAATAYWFL